MRGLVGPSAGAPGRGPVIVTGDVSLSATMWGFLRAWVLCFSDSSFLFPIMATAGVNVVGVVVVGRLPWARFVCFAYPGLFLPVVAGAGVDVVVVKGGAAGGDGIGGNVVFL